MDLNENLDIASLEFWQTFQEITNLLERARGFEILLRIVVQISQHAKIQSKQDFSKYSQGNFMFKMEKYDRLINTFFVKNKSELHAIRLIADNIAHGNFYNAHLKVNEYVNIFPLKTAIDETKKAGLFLLDHVEVDNGKYKIGYFVQPNSENLIIENFKAFKVQGYYDACIEIFERANEIINPEKKDIGKLNFAVTLMRGLKNGIREIKKEN
jgi:tetratricopeptide (TPR) repeat protein